MGNRIDVCVLDSAGDPVAGRLVKITVTGILSGGELKEYTDEDGHASFETYDDYEDSRDIYIRVGDHLSKQEIGGGAFTIQLD